MHIDKYWFCNFQRTDKTVLQLLNCSYLPQRPQWEFHTIFEHKLIPLTCFHSFKTNDSVYRLSTGVLVKESRGHFSIIPIQVIKWCQATPPKAYVSLLLQCWPPYSLSLPSVFLPFHSKQDTPNTIMHTQNFVTWNLITLNSKKEASQS